MAKTGTPTELGTQPIGKLLLQYAIPAIIAMTASSLYNMVDSIFIGHGVGPLAISGLAITFPLMNLAAAFGSLVYFYLSIPLGYSGSRHCHHSGSNHRTGVAIQNLHKQERIAPSPPRHLQTARYNCKKHHRYRYVSVPDESGSMLHCNFH